jgi:hypothetical protein
MLRTFATTAIYRRSSAILFEFKLFHDQSYSESDSGDYLRLLASSMNLDCLFFLSQKYSQWQFSTEADKTVLFAEYSFCAYEMNNVCDNRPI